MSKLKTIEYIYGGDYSTDSIKIFQKYFRVDWKFAKRDHIYYIDPESNITMCKPHVITFHQSHLYNFKHITFKTIKNHVNRLQKPKDALNRAAQQSTNRVQCTTSKITIASGHLEDRTINFRRRSKAKIGKANLSF